MARKIENEQIRVQHKNLRFPSNTFSELEFFCDLQQIYGAIIKQDKMFLNTESPSSRKFPLFEHQDRSSISSCSQLPSLYDSAISLDIPDFDLAKQNDVCLQSRDTLEAIVHSALDTNKNNFIRQEEGSSSPCRSMPQAEDCSLQQDSSAADNCHQVIISTNCERIPKVWDPHQVLPSSNASSERAAMTKKNRIRWTRELNKKFIECVNCLGGAKKATPKGILKLMNGDGLTISHVKSHLQSYRVTKYIHGCEEGISEILSQSTPLLDPKMSMQIIEALRLQIDIQGRLSEQLKSQTTLQLQIEEQAKQLEEMLNHQKEKNKTLVPDAK